LIPTFLTPVDLLLRRTLVLPVRCSAFHFFCHPERSEGLLDKSKPNLQKVVYATFGVKVKVYRFQEKFCGL
jgi:hypothetical protein